jgi:hypothetical protein
MGGKSSCGSFGSRGILKLRHSLNRGNQRIYYLLLFMIFLLLVNNIPLNCKNSRITLNPITEICVSDEPNAPILLAPSNGSVIEDTTPEFSWSVSSGASSYTLQLDNSSSFSSPNLIIIEDIIDTSFVMTTELQHGHWYWRVRGVNASGLGEFSATWEFSIIPSRTTITYPFPAYLIVIPILVISVVVLSFILVNKRKKSRISLQEKEGAGFLSPRSATIVMILVGLLTPYALLTQSFYDSSTMEHYSIIQLGAVFWQIYLATDTLRIEFLSGPELGFSMIVLVFHLAYALSIYEYLLGKQKMIRVILFWVLSQIPIFVLSIPRYMSGAFPGPLYYIGPTFITLITGYIILKLMSHSDQELWTS